jgi:hypothetical protein
VGRWTALVFLIACGDNDRPHVSPDSNQAAAANGGGCYPISPMAMVVDMLQLTDPEWTPVDGPNIDTNPVYVHGIANHAHGDTGGDFPFTHGRPDMTAEITPDLDDAWRLATGNLAGEHGEMEYEWENGAYPTWMIPGDGDRVVVFGRWIFDCGHPGGAPGHCKAATATECNLDSDCASDDRCVDQRFDYTSEIHPPRAVAVMRGGRGGIVADAGTPVDATRADVFVSPNGGGAGDRCMLTHYDVDKLLLDVQCFPLTQPVTDINSHDFSFDIPLPARPAGAHATWRVVDHPEDVFGGVEAAVDVAAFESDPSPHLAVTVKMTHSTPAGMPTGYASTIFAGWDAPAASQLVHVRLTIDAIAVSNALKPATTIVRDAPGWRAQAAANGEWQALTSLDQVHTGDVIAQGLVFDQYLPPSGELRLTANGVSSSCIDTLYNTNLSDAVAQLGFGPGGACLMASNPNPGAIDVTYAGPTFGAGTHETFSQHADGGHCSITPGECIDAADCPMGEQCTAAGTAFSLRYHIELP